MKLGEVVRLIPKDVEFTVEVYKASDETYMIYAYWIDPHDIEGRDDLEPEFEHEVTEIRPAKFHNKRPGLTIAIRDERY